MDSDLNQRLDRPSATPDDLAEAERLLLHLKYLLLLPTPNGQFVECLKAMGAKTPEGRQWSYVAAQPVLDRLSKKRLLAVDHCCLPALAHDITEQAIAAPTAERMVAAICKVLPVQPPWSSYYLAPDQVALCRLLRLAAYANDAYADDATAFDALATLGDKRLGPASSVSFFGNLFVVSPPPAAWFASRAPRMLPTLLLARLLAFTQAGTADDDLPAIIAQARAGLGNSAYESLRPVLLRCDLLANRLDAMCADFVGSDDDRLALDGTMAFLEGRNDAALALYRDALKARRKRLGKRKLFLPDEHGMFFLLALLRANDAALHAELQTGIEAALFELPEVANSAGWRAIQAMLWMAQGLEVKAQAEVMQLLHYGSPGPFGDACVALAEYAVDPALSRRRAGALDAAFQTLATAAPLAARVLAEILAAITSDPKPYLTWLDTPAAACSVTFTRLIAARQPWERALESLDALLGTRATKATTAKAPRRSKRLAWFVDPDAWDVHAVEQSPKGKDGWTDGRPVSMKRLRDLDPRLDYLTEQDRSALRHIRKDSGGWHGEDQYAFDVDRTIAALVGHPLVFDARKRSQRLDLVSYPLELLVTEHRGGYRIALSHSATDASVFLEPETPSRYRVVEFPKSLLPVQELLGPNGLTVPAAARARVIALAQRDNPALPVRAEIAEAQPGIDGLTAPVLQLSPEGEGLRVCLLVRPFGSSGPAYVAGLGGRSVLATIDGRQLRAVRDLPREVADRAAVIAACPTLRDRLGSDSHELTVDDLDGSLELLLELRDCAVPLTVEWPEGRTLRVSPVEPRKLRVNVTQERDWFSVDGSVPLDEDQVLEMRFLLDRLGQARGRFVPLGDGQFVALSRHLQMQLERLAAVSEPHRNGRRVHALGAPALDAVLDDAGKVSADAAWKKHVARIRAAEGWTPRLPATLQAELRDYQIEGFVWMSRLARWGAGACLADDMGLGKTVQAIAVLLDQAEEGPCLVVAPTSVCPNWHAEIARFAPTLRTHALAGDRAALVNGLSSRDVLICSYTLLHLAAEELGTRPWRMVVLDEAQAIKNAETRRAQATSSLQADFRLALTGTPVENYLDELWSLFAFVNPGFLGSREGFQKRFARPIERDRDPAARQALRALIRPFMLRRTKAMVLHELPPRTEQTMRIEMEDGERAFYEALRRQSLDRLATLDAPAGQRKIQILAEITRLRRACCNPALIDQDAGVPSGKLAAFLDLVDDLVRNRHRALVFSQFVAHLALVRAALDARGIRYEYLDGSTPAADRERRVAAFQAGTADVFLISLRAGGTGLNLTAADYVVHLDPWWNPAVEDQASDRAHRIGQERPVTIYRLIMQDSIEEQILHLHRDKRDLAAGILEGGEVSARLSADDLLALIKG